MTSRGLECVDCDGLIDYVDHHKYDDELTPPPPPAPALNEPTKNNY